MFKTLYLFFIRSSTNHFNVYLEPIDELFKWPCMVCIQTIPTLSLEIAWDLTLSSKTSIQLKGTVLEQTLSAFDWKTCALQHEIYSNQFIWKSENPSSILDCLFRSSKVIKSCAIRGQFQPPPPPLPLYFRFSLSTDKSFQRSYITNAKNVEIRFTVNRFIGLLVYWYV